MGRYVIAYDIPCNRRRRKVAKLLEGYGRRVQYSVFECTLTTAQLAQLEKRLRPRLKPDVDSLKVYTLSASAGVEQRPAGPEPWIV